MELTEPPRGRVDDPGEALVRSGSVPRGTCTGAALQEVFDNRGVGPHTKKWDGLSAKTLRAVDGSCFGKHYLS